MFTRWSRCCFSLGPCRPREWKSSRVEKSNFIAKNSLLECWNVGIHANNTRDSRLSQLQGMPCDTPWIS